MNNFLNIHPAGAKIAINGILSPHFSPHGDGVIFGYTLRREFSKDLRTKARMGVIIKLLRQGIQIPNISFTDLSSMEADDLDSGQPDIPPEIYQPGIATGRLKFIRAEDLEAAFRSGAVTTDDIIVVDEVPNDAMPAAAFISTRREGKFTHLHLFAGMLGVPFVFIPPADMEEYRRFDGQMIFFQALRDPHGGTAAISQIKIIPPITGLDFSPLRELTKRPKVHVTPPNLTVTDIRPLDSLPSTDANSFGAKAANLGFLMETLGQNQVPQGVAIPFHFYSTFLAQAQVYGVTLSSFIAEKLNELKGRDGKGLTFLETAHTLEEIRRVIENATIPKGLLREIIDGVKDHVRSNKRGYLWRSSSSVEDGEQFNGAGLYESADSDDLSEEKVAEALKKVWASLYSQRAYYTRSLFGIDESLVEMGVVAHGKHEENQIANGVSTLEWPTEPNDSKPAFIVNHSAFKGNQVLVTSPMRGLIPESIRLELNAEGNRFSTKDGAMILDDDSVFSPSLLKALSKAMLKIQKAWPYSSPESDGTRGFDIEWYVRTGEFGDQLVIRQVRPHPHPHQPTQQEIEQAFERLQATPAN